MKDSVICRMCGWPEAAHILKNDESEKAKKEFAKLEGVTVRKDGCSCSLAKCPYFDPVKAKIEVEKESEEESGPPPIVAPESLFNSRKRARKR